MHPTQDTSRIRIARVKQEEEADTRKGSVKYGRKERGQYKGISPKQGLTNAKDLNIEHPEYLHHSLD